MNATQPDDGSVTHVAVVPGDDVLETLRTFVSANQIEAAQFSASGGFQRATVGWYDRDRLAYKQIHIDEPSEVLSLLGGIASGEDGPKVHAQVVLGLSDGTTRGGHLLASSAGRSLDIVMRDAHAESTAIVRPSSLRARSIAIVCGIALILLGAWGAISPFVTPSFGFGFAPDTMWQWSSARGWLEVLPGCVAAVGGLVMIISPNRIVIALGGALAAISGAWFIVGISLADLLHIGSVGAPLGTRPGIQSLEWLALFYGLGAVIVLLVAFVLGRLSVRSRGRAQPQRIAAPVPVAPAVAPEAVTGEIRWDGAPAPAH
jgi:predicted DNA-binding protein with PD1-like motif